MLLKLLLEGAGFHVNEATNGRHGLELFLKHSADLVIADIAMPEMNGLDFMLELTNAFLDVKVIAMTGASSEESQKATLLGARQVFQKPLTHKPFSLPYSRSCVINSSSPAETAVWPLRRASTQMDSTVSRF